MNSTSSRIPRIYKNIELIREFLIVISIVYKKFYDKLIQSDGRFSIETVECLVRNWDLKVVRPYSRMLGHTGFITFARLIGRKE
ncbi:MAG: hypothetical protein CVT90_00765 [Candidatus Altiarchaeales archaeon HGW-Altiarchaeales-3]|nr:MAG: hypothetical protein CVT90_00765 [Candidatus Altiarchaeales archaeon HGW-Altiarchaeales-3]